MAVMSFRLVVHKSCVCRAGAVMLTYHMSQNLSTSRLSHQHSRCQMLQPWTQPVMQLALKYPANGRSKLWCP